MFVMESPPRPQPRGQGVLRGTRSGLFFLATKSTKGTKGFVILFCVFVTFVAIEFWRFCGYWILTPMCTIKCHTTRPAMRSPSRRIDIQKRGYPNVSDRPQFYRHSMATSWQNCWSETQRSLSYSPRTSSIMRHRSKYNFSKCIIIEFLISRL